MDCTMHLLYLSIYQFITIQYKIGLQSTVDHNCGSPLADTCDFLQNKVRESQGNDASIHG
jgi:hypothetical protein